MREGDDGGSWSTNCSADIVSRCHDSHEADSLVERKISEVGTEDRSWRFEQSGRRIRQGISTAQYDEFIPIERDYKHQCISVLARERTNR